MALVAARFGLRRRFLHYFAGGLVAGGEGISFKHDSISSVPEPEK